MRRRLAWVVLAAAAAPAAAQDHMEPVQEAPAWRFSGYAKVLGLRSATVDGERDKYGLAVGRVRLKLRYDLPERFKLHLEHDTELQAGSYLRTAEYRAARRAPRAQYWSAGSTIAGGKDAQLLQRFFRAYGTLSLARTDVSFGRQRIPIGTGRFWSTVDMLNPVNPLQVERDEYVGVDAVLVEQRLGDLSKLSAVYAPDPARRHDRWMLRHRTHHGEADVSLTYARYWGERLFAVDTAATLGDAGLRGEWAFVKAEHGMSNYHKALLGIDYGFASTLTLSAEAYFSGQGTARRLAMFQRYPLLARVLPYGDRNLGLAVGYDLTPLLKVSGTLLHNLRDNSRMAAARVEYSLSSNATLSGGAQWFGGSERSEYGSRENLYHVQLQQFF